MWMKIIIRICIRISSFETKSMVKDFLYSNIYSPSTQFFNLCVNWNINEIFKPICICLQEVGNSRYLNVHSNNYPFLCHYNTILRKVDPNIPGMRSLSISVHRSCSFSPDLFEYKYIISVNITSFWGIKCTIGNMFLRSLIRKKERMPFQKLLIG